MLVSINVMIKIIAAADEAGAIGQAGTLPWPRLPGDMARFKALTYGHSIVMGRKTYDSIGQALPERRTIVLSRAATSLPDAEVINDIAPVLELAKTEDVWVIGGAQIYTLFLPYASELYITVVHAVQPNADTFFPPYDKARWQLKSTEPGPNDAPVTYDFYCYSLKQQG